MACCQRLVERKGGDRGREMKRANGGVVVDFYNQINLLYGSITEFCSPTTCPEMKATDEYELPPPPPWGGYWAWC